MKIKLKIGVLISVILTLFIYACGSHNLIKTKREFKRVFFNIPKELNREELPLNEIKVNYLHNSNCNGELLIQIYGFSRGAETMELSEAGEFIKKVGPWKIRAVMLFLKNGKIEGTSFIQTQGQGKKNLMTNFELEINRTLQR